MQSKRMRGVQQGDIDMTADALLGVSSFSVQ